MHKVMATNMQVGPISTFVHSYFVCESCDSSAKLRERAGLYEFLLLVSSTSVFEACAFVICFFLKVSYLNLIAKFQFSI